MREVVFATPNRMQIDTGHREFDMSVGCIAPGNRVDGGCHSNYIRAFNTPTNPGGAPCLPGEMQKFDLGLFRDLPAAVRDYVGEVGRDEEVILYEIRHSSSRRDGWGERITIRHGYIVTRGHKQDHELLRKFYCGPTRKSKRVVDVCSEYVANFPAPEPPATGPRRRLSLLAAP